MTPKVFLGTAIVTVITLVVAIFSVVSEAPIKTVDAKNESAFAELHGNPNAVTKVTLRDAENTFTLVRDGDGQWVAPDKFGYQADSGKIRDLVVKLADMRLVEPKTVRPTLYHRLEVEDLEDEDAESQLVRLESESGEVLAEALFGKSVYRKTGPANSGIYLRRVGDERAWLASGDPNLDVEVTSWLDRTIVDLVKDDVRRVTIEPGAGKAYTVERSEGEEDFRIADLAENVTAKQSDVNRMGSALANLSLQDVKPKDEVTWPASMDIARFETFDNLGLEARLAQVDDKTWITVSAAYLGDEAEESEVAEASQRKAEEINERVGNWAYQISDYAANRLRRPLADLLEDPSNTS